MALMGATPLRVQSFPLGLAAALAFAGCSDAEPTPAGSGGSPGSSGAGGTTSAGGSTSEAPTVESVTSDIIKITELPTTVVVSASVTDPQGDDDVVGGSLSSGGMLGDFVPTGVPGGYQLELVVDESLGWSPQGYRVLLATFVDQVGNVAEGSTGIEMELTGCTVAGSYDACRECFCAADPAGCASYVAFEHEHLYCGSTCSGTCDAFCQTLPNPDPQLIDAGCAACEPSNEDVGAFEQACLGDIPDCFGFLVDVGQCPRR